MPKPVKFYTDNELPTVSILIPARNEDEVLTDCIRSAIASDYPKLEIIVLDDCSQDKSSDIIKRFAHNGVRFIQGVPPKEGWLAKNQAYETLADAASGEWLLLSGVDVRFSPTTIRSIVTHALSTKKTMLSVMPFRRGSSFSASLLSPLRYWYEMALPRDVVGFPAVLSTCWIVQKKAFKRIGGFSAMSRAVIPEIYFAREFSAKQHYQFVRSNDYLTVYTTKSLYEQYLTALRTRYPQVHRKIETVALATLGIGLLLVGPFVAFFAAVIAGETMLAVLFGISAVLLILAHEAIVTVSNPIAWPLSFVNFPLLALQEAGLLHISMYQYEFTEVIWKGRNVCYPVMHVTPSLPKLD